MAVIGGARLTNEDAYAWAKLAKGVIGTDHVDAQLGDGLPAEAVAAWPAATIDDVCRPGGTVVLMAPDLKEELPVLYLRLRHAVERDGVRLIELGSLASGLAAGRSGNGATTVLHTEPGRLADLVDALIAGDTAAARDLGCSPDALDVAAAQLDDGDVRLVVGRGSIAESGARVADAVNRFVAAHDGTTVLPVLRRANVRGALDMGLTPGLLPGRVVLDAAPPALTEAWGQVPTATGMDAPRILRAAADGGIDVLVLLGADPLVDAPDRRQAAEALERTGTVIALDLFATESVAAADIVLPAAGFGECDGSTTNLEGRVSTVRRRVTPPGSARSDWSIAADLARRLDADLGVESVEGVQAEIATVAASHADVTPERLADGGHDGIVVTTPADGGLDARRLDVPALPAPDNYSLRLFTPRRLYDAGTLVAHAPSLAGLAGEAALHLSPRDFDKLGVDDGARVKVTSAVDTMTVAVHRDARVATGAAVIPLHQPGGGGAQLIDARQPVTDVRIETGPQAEDGR